MVFFFAAFCEFNGKHYDQNQIWYQACDFKCTCEEPATNNYRCVSRSVAPSSVHASMQNAACHDRMSRFGGSGSFGCVVVPVVTLRKLIAAEKTPWCWTPTQPSYNPLWLPRSGELRTQKLKSHFVRTQSLNVLPLKLRVGQYIAIHAALTGFDFFLAYV